MASKIKGLLLWCQKMTNGYPDVNVKNFTTSWRDGLAFCAIIHRFRPDLIDYDSLSKENVFDNNHLAFTVGEKELDIPAFLEASDMVALRTPDKLSVITYVSQYYNKLCALPQLGGPGVQGKKTTSTASGHGIKRHQPAEPLSEPEPKKQSPATKSGAGDSTSKVKTLGDRCAICNNKVYLLERHVEEGKLYHRSCFRHSDLSPSNKVYTRSPFLSPSLHGKEGRATSPATSPTALSPGDRGFSNSSSRTHGVDDKHGVKRSADDGGCEQTGGRAEVRKFLFSKDGDTKNRPAEHNKTPAKDFGPDKSDVSKDRQFQSGFATSTPKQKSSGAYTKELSTPQANSQTFQTHTSADFLSTGKDAKDVKSPKRQLPLVFQSAGSSGDGASDKSKNGAEAKVSERSSGPVAKPRNFGKKMSGDTSEMSQERPKSSAFPRPSPRSSVSTLETSQKSVADKPKSPSIPRKVPARSKSPARDLSPPPLPSSAPPSVPQATSVPLSPRYLPRSTSPQPSPVRQTTPALTSQDIVSQSKPTSSKLSSSNALSRPSQSTPQSSSSKSSSASESNVRISLLTSNNNKPSFSNAASPQHEEPMEVETAFSKARSQYGEQPADKEQQDKKALSGLLISLAQVRDANCSASTPTTVTSSSRTAVQTPNRGVETLTTVTTSSPLPTNSSSVGKVEEKQSTPIHESRGKSSLSISLQKSGGTPQAVNSDKTLPVCTVGDTVTFRLNPQKKTVEDSAEPVSTLLKQKQNEKSSDRVPLYKKKTDSDLLSRTNKPGNSPRHTTDKGVSQGTEDITGKKARPKSAAGVLTGKDLSISKQAVASTDSSRPAPFTQVKLKESGFSTLERSERAKSAVSIFDSSADSRPSWQQEAERKKAVFRDIGFVDPETKKTVGKSAETKTAVNKSASPVDDDNTQKHDTNKKREAPPRPAPVHSLTSDTSPKEGKPSQAKSTEVMKKGDEIRVNVGNASKDNSSAPHSEEAGPSVSADNLENKTEKTSMGARLKGMLKSGNRDTPKHGTTKTAPPEKPKRRLRGAEKELPEIKVSPAVAETPNTNDTATSCKQTQVTGKKKKITVSELKDFDSSLNSSLPSSPSHTVPPNRPPPPSQPSEGWKKISVDMNFDFNSSLEASGRFQSPTAEKTTPPARPPPPHRTSMSPGRLSAIELQQQLLDIDSKLSELELRGRHLEDSIRSVAAEEEDEDLMMEWFQLVSEKNDLVRRECDLVYMSREQDLQDEQSQIESQLYYLLSKDENDKSLEEQEEEEYLIQHKVAIVNQRNSIVDSMDEDRLRYEEEDRDIAQMLQVKGFIKDGSTPPSKDKGKGAQAEEKRVGSSKFFA